MTTTEAELRAAGRPIPGDVHIALRCYDAGRYDELDGPAAMAAIVDAARAYAGDHPADDAEPLTAAWLESVGIVRGCFDDRCYGWHHGARCFTLTVKTPRGYASNIDIHTRGQVRAILSALS